MRLAPIKKLAGGLAHLFIALAILLGGRALAADQPIEEGPAQEPAQPAEEPAAAEETDTAISYIQDLVELAEEEYRLTVE